MGMANRMGVQQFDNGVTIFPSGNQPFGDEPKTIEDYKDFKADMLITLKEPWVFRDLPQWAINFVPIVPIDHSPVSAGITSRLNTAFKVIAISRHGQRELRQSDIPSTYIPHGVDTSKYVPLPDHKQDCKKLWYGKYAETTDFIIGVVAMNRARKMIPRMLRGYKRFRENNPDIKCQMMLWTDIRASELNEEAMIAGIADVSVDLLPEIIQLGLNDCIIWPDRELIRHGIPEWMGDNYTSGWDMVKLYNSFDALLNCTGGEGFSMTQVEAQACGIPVLTTDYAAGPEQVGAGLTVPPSDYIVFNVPGTRYALADIDKMAEALTKIYNADKEKLAKRAREFSLRYDWNKIITDFWGPFLADAEIELKPKWVKGGLESWA